MLLNHKWDHVLFSITPMASRQVKIAVAYQVASDW
jgi:hypothetical protein